MNRISRVSQCSSVFLINCLATKIISIHPLPLWNPYWDSGRTVSAIVCSLSCTILAKTLPTPSRRPIPLQLVHALKSPFLGMGTIPPVINNPVLHLQLHNQLRQPAPNSLPPARIISGKMSVFPPVLPPLILPNAKPSSSTVGGASRS